MHGFAGPLGGMYHAAHGALCAALLPTVMETNLEALQSRVSDSPALGRYEQVARLITGIPDARAADGICWVRDLCGRMQIKPLAAYGIEKKDFNDIVAKARRASSMKGNPVALTEDELLAILQKAL